MDEYHFSGEEEKNKNHSKDTTDKKSESKSSEKNFSFPEDSPLRRALEQPPLKRFKVEHQMNHCNFKIIFISGWKDPGSRNLDRPGQYWTL